MPLEGQVPQDIPKVKRGVLRLHQLEEVPVWHGCSQCGVEGPKSDQTLTTHRLLSVQQTATHSAVVQLGAQSNGVVKVEEGGDGRIGRLIQPSLPEHPR
jgi:hypothetical protein